MTMASKYGPEVQKVAPDTPFEDLIYLLKRDGGVFVKNFVSENDVDQAFSECRERLENDVEWQGSFFPKQTQRAPGLLALSPTYARTQVMHPTYQKICEHFLTTRSWFWWGDEKKESVSKPYLHSSTAMRIGPGGQAQPLHRDDYINHNIHEEISEWDDERDKNRETSLGLFVAGSRITKENGGTQFIPKSHLWATDHPNPPSVDDCIFSDMHKGDAFIMLASAYHGGGHNSTADEHRLLFSTFSVRGYMRQEENQFLTVPLDVAKKYEQDVQVYMGYHISDPACGYVDQQDPIALLRPELKEGPKDF